MIGTEEIKKKDIERKSTGNRQIAIRDHIEGKFRYLFVKRVFDVTVSMILILLVFSWLFPILFLLIKLDSKGPIFFVQRRVGFLGRSFPCLKFRTMYVNDEANTRQASDNDPRITKVGKFLRNSNLDELPQFLNVLAGHMSIVGPRPHMHNDCINFSSLITAYKFRNLMKPGITGLSQVKGFRGPAMDFERIFKRYQWDAFYVRNASFWLDLRIIHSTAVQTFAYVFKFLFVQEETQQPYLGGSELRSSINNILN